MKRNSFFSIRLMLAISILAALVALALPVGVKTAAAETEGLVKVTIVNHVGCQLKALIKGPGLPAAGVLLIINNGASKAVKLKSNTVYSILLKSSCCGKAKLFFNSGGGGTLTYTCSAALADQPCRLEQSWAAK